MRHIISILLLACISLSSYAQTPYDSFAPETSRPVLELSEIKESKEGSKNTALTDTVVILDVDVRKWLSVDPLADKYPNISPYAYCGWNPIKFVDPSGEDYTVNVDDEAGTISIAAKYYVNQQDAPSAQHAIDFWNNQSDKFAYKTKDKQYAILFDLQIETVDSPTQSLINDKTEGVNAYVLHTPSNTNTSGYTAEGNQIVVNPMYQFGQTGAHEVGHSLGMEHTLSGIMTEAQDSPGRRLEVTPTNIGQCISNVFKTCMYNADAKGTIHGSLNRHGKVIKIQ